MTNEQKLREALQDVEAYFEIRNLGVAAEELLLKVREALSQPPTSDEGTPTETPLTDALVLSPMPERVSNALIDHSDSLQEAIKPWISLCRQLERTLHAKERELANIERLAILQSVSAAPHGWTHKQVTGPDEYGSVYVYFQQSRKGAVGKTVQHSGEITIDYDKEGNLFGIELLGVHAAAPQELDGSVFVQDYASNTATPPQEGKAEGEHFCMHPQCENGWLRDPDDPEDPGQPCHVCAPPATPRGDGGEPWKCAARAQGTAGGNDPTECDWPTCGCDPYANKVIASLQESGLLAVPENKNGD